MVKCSLFSCAPSNRSWCAACQEGTCVHTAHVCCTHVLMWPCERCTSMQQVDAHTKRRRAIYIPHIAFAANTQHRNSVCRQDADVQARKQSKSIARSTNASSNQLSTGSAQANSSCSRNTHGRAPQLVAVRNKPQHMTQQTLQHTPQLYPNETTCVCQLI